MGTTKQGLCCINSWTIWRLAFCATSNACFRLVVHLSFLLTLSLPPPPALACHQLPGSPKSTTHPLPSLAPQSSLPPPGQPAAQSVSPSAGLSCNHVLLEESARKSVQLVDQMLIDKFDDVLAAQCVGWPEIDSQPLPPQASSDRQPLLVKA